MTEPKEEKKTTPKKNPKFVKMFARGVTERQNPTCYGYKAKQVEFGFMEVLVPFANVKTEKLREHGKMASAKEYQAYAKERKAMEKE